MQNDPVGHVDLWGLTASDSSFTSRIQIDDVNSAIANLTTAQKMTREAPMYQYEAGGNYNLPGPGKSWCNQSTFDVMEATGFHTEGLFVTEGSYTGRYNTNANYASASLKKLSDNSDETGIVEVTPKEAQLYANKGATVVAAWEGNITADGNQAKGHMSTVVPESTTGLRYSEEKGPVISNIGGTVGVMTTEEGFWRADSCTGGWEQNVHFYIDTNQTMTFDSSNIAKDKTKP